MHVANSRLAWSRRLLVAVVALGSLFRASLLQAKAQFELPPHCGNYQQFTEAVQQRLGREATPLLAALVLRISEQGGGYVLTMRIGSVSRQLEDASCNDLFRAAVVVAIALWENPSTATDETSNSAASDPRPQAAAPTAAPQTQARPEASAGFVPTWLVSGDVGVNGGLQPKLGPGFRLSGALDGQWFGARAGLHFLPPSSSRDENGRGVRVMVLGGSLVGYVKPISAIALELGLSTYQLAGTGLGSRTVTNAVVVSLGPCVGLRVIPWQSGSVFGFLGAEGHLELLRPNFIITQYGEVFRVSQLSWTSFLGAGYRFR